MFEDKRSEGVHMETQKHPKVFISYSHKDDAYEQKMLGFANRLRDDGIDANIDLYYPTPSEGWPRWMENQINAADFIIVVCNESYWKKCYEGSGGKGVIWEVNMVYQKLYDERCDTTKFIPVIWNQGDEQFILTPIKPYTHYNIGTEDGYQGLWRHILNIPKYTKPELGKINPEKYERIEPLPEKKQRTMFFSTPIDLEKWNAARWKGMVYLLSPDASLQPVLGFLFRDYNAGLSIFEQWRKSYAGFSPDDYLKITFVVPPLPKDCYVYSDPEKSYGKGYFVHVGVNEDKAIERAVASGLEHEEILLTFISRYIWVDEMNGSWNRETFFKQIKQLGKYTVIPMGMKDEKEGINEENLLFGYEYGLEMKNAYCKRGIDIGEDDQCKAVLSKATDAE